jgi:hypothetical protein
LANGLAPRITYGNGYSLTRTIHERSEDRRQVRRDHQASGGINLYGYVGSRPTTSSDPFGLAPSFISPSERVTRGYNRATGRIDITVNVPDPFPSEIEAVYVHENEHMRIDKAGLKVSRWKDEQEAFRKELEYLDKRIEQLKAVESSDYRSGKRLSATEELNILRARRAEADGITAYDSEAKRYVEKHYAPADC